MSLSSFHLHLSRELLHRDSTVQHQFVKRNTYVTQKRPTTLSLIISPASCSRATSENAANLLEEQVCVGVCVCVRERERERECECMCVCLCMYVYLCVRVCVYVCMCAFVFMYVCVHVSVCVSLILSPASFSRATS